MRVPNTVRWGLGLALATALISGVSVFLNGQFVKLFHDPTLLAAVRNGLVGMVLIAVAIANGGLREIVRVGWRQRLGLVAVGVVGGGISFALFFNGLALSSSPAAAIIHKTLFIWVAALAIPFLGERVGALQVASLGLLLAGTLVLAPAGSIGTGTGELLVVAATLLWSLEVIVVKRLLRGGVPVSLVAASRMAIGAVALFSIAGATGDAWAVVAFTAQQWFAIAVTGTLLTGYVLTWFGALQRAPATSVTSILVVGAVVTTVLQSWSTGGLPAPTAAFGNVLLLAGGAVAVAAAWLAGGFRATSPATVPTAGA
jgi:drug/metabolite transporter (DMT)-like permease